MPENIAGNVNEPLEVNHYNSYTFLLDAKKISVDYSRQADFTSLTSRISITISDYSSGSVKFQIRDNQLNSRFSYLGNKNVESYTEVLDGFVPISVELQAANFTGKLKIQLSSIY